MGINVDKIAKLACLQITDDEKPQYKQELTNILSLVAQMEAADVENIKPQAHPLDAKQPLRKDEITEHLLKSGQYEKLQQLAPQTEAGLFLVPKVVE